MFPLPGDRGFENEGEEVREREEGLLYSGVEHLHIHLDHNELFSFWQALHSFRRILSRRIGALFRPRKDEDDSLQEDSD